MFKPVSTTITLSLVGLALAGCKVEKGTVYDMTKEQVYAKLLDKRLIQPTVAKKYTEAGTFHRVDSLRYQYMTFAYNYGGTERWRYIVSLDTVSETRTRVSIELFPGKFLTSLPRSSVKMTYGKAAERVFSTIEDRPFSDRKVSNYTMAYITMNPVETHSDINKVKAKAIAAAREAGIKVE
ncbi:MAG: hypothetical protein ABJM26_18205 [Anderseniella sp.]